MLTKWVFLWFVDCCIDLNCKPQTSHKVLADSLHASLICLDRFLFRVNLMLQFSQQKYFASSLWSASTPGVSASSPGGSASSPGVSAPFPGVYASSPGVSASSSGGLASSSGGLASSPGISASSPGGSTLSPGVFASSPGGSASSPGGSASSPGGSASSPGGSAPYDSCIWTETGTGWSICSTFPQENVLPGKTLRNTFCIFWERGLYFF